LNIDDHITIFRVYLSENIGKVRKHVKKSPILTRNKTLILQFIDELAAEGISKTRQQKYCYTLIPLSKMITDKDWSNMTKDDIKKLCGEINNYGLCGMDQA
jgi:hypothetical protein